MQIREQTTTTEKRPGKSMRGGVMIALMVLLLLTVFLSAAGFSRYLREQLFLERQTHLLEITGKVSEIIDVVIDAAWGGVNTCEQLLLDKGALERETVLDELSDMPRYINARAPVVLAFDQTATYYSSDGESGHWSDPTVLLPTQSGRLVSMAALPYLEEERTYMVFIQRLDGDIPLGDGTRRLTHVAVALEMEQMQSALAVAGFEDRSHTYIVNSTGRRLYRNAGSLAFIEGYNILSALERVTFLNGGDMDDLRSAVGNERKACLEFRYGEENYFVGTALIPSVGWEVMLFVPTQVLGANTAALLNRTSQFFLAIGGTVLALLAVAMVTITSSHNDRRLMRQQRETNALLTQAAEEADRANRAKSQFLSHMSHDIRTPINGIMGMTDIALRKLDDREKAADCLKKIDTASRHLLSLVNDVLDMSSIENGKISLNREAMDLRAVLNNCASIISGQLIERQMDFSAEFGDFAHPALFGDELRLRQVLINILSNAVKFTPDGGRIVFRAEELGTEGWRARFRFVVEDSGKGMSQEFLSSIFEPFSQEDGDGRSTYTGTGLGMAITKQFVDLMEGDIQVDSQLGVGSKFTVELSFDIDAAGTVRAALEPENVDLTGMRVLLVEDNELNMEIARYLLEEDGVRVTTATNGQEAVDVFTAAPEESFDAILMDVMMPVMDGMEATRIIRALPRRDAVCMPIIAMTANAYEEDRKRTRQAGMNVHLSKPIDRAMLLRTLSFFYHGGDKGQSK